jgi:hypothetical protein
MTHDGVEEGVYPDGKVSEDAMLLPVDGQLKLFTLGTVHVIGN